MTSTTATTTPLLLRAAQGEVLERPPVWLMRQAGRYMAEYQAIRGKTNFLTLCKTPDLAVEVSLQPYRAFGMDAVIMFSDILIPPEAMGLPLEFNEKGPVLPEPLKTPADLKRLHIPDPQTETPFVLEILRTLRAELPPEVALLGFAGAPWTLAAYMIEGGVSKNYTQLKQWMHNEPEALHRLLGMLTETVTVYLQAQVAAGAQVVQLFDTWAGIVPASVYREWILPYERQIIQAIPAPVTLYVNGSAHLLADMATSGAAIISVDWLTPLDEARRLVGPGPVLQGNLDPNTLFARPEVLKPQVQQMVETGMAQGPYIANLGHGVLPKTPVENVRLFVDTVQQFHR